MGTDGSTDHHLLHCRGIIHHSLKPSDVLTIHSCTVHYSFSVQVGKPNVGENRPSRVKADITIELTVNDTVKREWEGTMSKHVSTPCTSNNFTQTFSITGWFYVHI